MRFDQQIAAFHKDLAAVMASPSPFFSQPSRPGGSSMTTEAKADALVTAAEDLREAIENDDGATAKEKMKEVNHLVAGLQDEVAGLSDFTDSNEDAESSEG